MKYWAIAFAGLVSPAIAFTQQPRIDSIFSSIGATDPGCAVGVYRNGHVQFSKGYGLADREVGTPITPSTLFALNSITKQFVSGAITELALEGKLSLDDDARKYVPELRDFGARITLRDLMRHRSGIREEQTINEVVGARPLPAVGDRRPASAVERRLDVINQFDRLAFDPGSAYAYSNTEYFILTNVISRVSGISVRAYLNGMLDRAGMQASFARYADSVDTAREAVSARGYVKADSGWRRGPVDAATVVSSIEDLVRWDEHFYDPRARRWVELMQDPGTFTDGRPAFYAHGLAVGTYRGLPVISHDGAGTMQSALIRFPTKHVSIAVLCNYRLATPAMALASKVAEVVLPGEFPVRIPPTPAAPATFPWSGLYVDTVGGSLIYRISPAGMWRIDDSTYVDDRYFTIAHFSRGWSPALRVEQPMRQIALDRVEPWTPSQAELAPLEGVYVNDTFDVRHTVTIQNGALWLQRPGRDAVRLEPLFKDAFSAGRFVVLFRRDASSRVTALSYRTERLGRLDMRRAS